MKFLFFFKAVSQCMCMCVCTLCLSLHLLRHIWVVSNIVWVNFIWLSVFGIFCIFISFENGFAGSYSNCLVFLISLAQWLHCSGIPTGSIACFQFPYILARQAYLCCVWGECWFVLFCFLLDSHIMDVEFCFIVMSLDINTLSERWFAYSFSHSVGWLHFLSIVSFDTQVFLF